MRKSTLFWGAVIILIGILLLVSNFVEIDIGSIIWPLILIALGAWILWGAFAGPRSFEAEEAMIPLKGATQASVRIRHGAGKLDLRAGAGPDELATGTFGGGLDQKTKREGDTLDVEMRVRSSGPHFIFPWMWGPGRTLDWSVELNDAIPLTLEVETGASDTRLDLTDLQIIDLRVQTGASSTNITLPANASYTKADIHSGAASVRIRVPPSVAACIRVSSGLAGVTVDRDRFPRVGGIYQSEDYDTATNKVELNVEASVGAVDIR